MQKIGINVSPDVLYGAESFLRSLAAVGFESVFTDGDDPAFVRWLTNRCASSGLTVETLHAPFHHINDLWTTGPGADALLRELEDCVDLAAENGIPIVVTHLSSGENCPHVNDAGLLNFDRLVDHAAKKGVKLAVENQRKLGNISVILEMYGKDTPVGFCWDVGHEACFAHGREYMPLFGDRCITTHIHDNNCLYNVDEHLLPFDGQIDFRRTADLIHNSGYHGPLMLEVDLPHEGSDKYNRLSVDQFTAKAFAAINRLRVIAQ